MNKYKSLAKNTAIFAIGTFSSKVLSFIMVFFYSRAMQTDEFGVLDIIVNSASLLLPIAMLGITNGIIRFGLDDENKKSDVFTTALISVAIGFGLLLAFSPLIMKVEDLRKYIVLLYLYVLMSSLRHICSYFIRADNRVKLYAADGVFSTFMTCLLTIIFLIPLKMGIRGYLLAVILADFSSVIFLSIGGKIFKNIKFKGLNTSLTRRMIRFSVPLIPTSLLWWVINVSDRYFVKYMIGADANGLYSVAYKIPTVLTLVATIFLDAWQISAVKENTYPDRNRFYTNVFASFSGLVFVASAVLILFAKFVTKILLAESYYTSWRYIPLLMLATVFSCFVTFLGDIYLVEKRSVSTLLTTVIGAVLNIFLNYLLIPSYGPNGAAFATCVSYFAVFLVRGVDIHKRNPGIGFSPFKVFINSLLTLALVFVMLSEAKYWIAAATAITILITAFNSKELIASAKRILKK